MKKNNSVANLLRHYGPRLFAVTLCLSPAAALAQAAPVSPSVVPGSANPGRIEERFQQPDLAPATSAPLTIKREDTAAPEGADKTTLSLNQVVIEGATVYSQAQLDGFWQAEQGKQVTLSDIYKIADDITVKYRNDGYILAKAVIPPQRIENGVVHIRVVEGYIIRSILTAIPRVTRRFWINMLSRSRATAPCAPIRWNAICF